MEQIKVVACCLSFIIRAYDAFLRKIVTARNSMLVRHCGHGVVFFAKTRVKGGQNVTIGNNVIIRKGCTIAAQTEYFGQILKSSIVIEDGADLGEDCFITASNSIVIGSNVLFGRLVTVTDNSHGSTSMEDLLLAPHQRKILSKGEVVKGKNVWIGDKVTILPNVHIGEGAVVGANAVVTKDVPPYSVVGGIPAKVISKNG